MKTYRPFIIAFVLFIMQTASVQTQTLIAHYPLKSHANDSTGNHTAMVLVNTPFRDGGIYCNGIADGTDKCNAYTPDIVNFNNNSFSIRAKFKVSEYPFYDKPVFVCGGGWRWIAFYLESNGTVSLKYNNNQYLTSNVPYSLDTWYEATITYIDSIAKLFLDDSLIVSLKTALIHNNDNWVLIKDQGNAQVFKGIFSDLRIYTGDIYTKVPENPSGLVPGSFVLFQNYPNPFNATTIVSFEIPHRSMTTLTIHDVMGREVKTLLNEMKETGSHHVIWDGENNLGQKASSGMYIVTLRTCDGTRSHKMLLLR